MQNFRNYYQILNVAKEATPDDIKRAYRRLARQYHPDLNPGDKAAEETFKDIGEAYEILSDPDRRAKYDQFSRYWMQGSFKKNGTATKVRRGAAARKSSEDMEFSQYRDFNTFIDQLLNRRDEPTTSRATSSDPFRPGTSKKSYTVPRPSPRHAEARLTVPMERAYQGGRERIRLEDGRSLEVNMPPGMLSGQKVRLKGQGVNGGDLFLKIELAPHPFFRMQGTDLYCQLPITPCEAVLGGAIEVPTLDGMVKMMVPAGVRSGQKLRMAGKGYPINGQRGDQIVEVLVLVPRDVSEPERELYEKLRQVETFNPRADLLV